MSIEFALFIQKIEEHQNLKEEDAMFYFRY